MNSTYSDILNDLVKILLNPDCKYKEAVEECIRISAKTIKNDGRILVCGNGGSAATASHIANDLMCHMRNWNRKGYRVMALTDNCSAVTSLTNDYGFDQVFAKQVDVFGESGDVLWAFSTSGNSKNCIEGIKKAREKGLKTAAFTGRAGGAMAKISDIWVPVDSEDVTRVEEIHMIYAHIIGENIEAIVSPLTE